MDCGLTSLLAVEAGGGASGGTLGSAETADGEDSGVCCSAFAGVEPPSGVTAELDVLDALGGGDTGGG